MRGRGSPQKKNVKSSDESDSLKPRKNKRIGAEIGVVASLVIFIATLAYVQSVPLDSREAVKKELGGVQFRIFSDPRAQIWADQTTEPEQDEIKWTNTQTLTVEDLGENAQPGWSYELTLKRDGFDPVDIIVTDADTRGRVFPPVEKPVIRLRPSSPLAYMDYLTAYRPKAALLLVTSLVGLGLSVVFIRQERRRRRVLERYEADPDADSFIGKFLHGYFVTKVLGTGGFGKVYRVLDEATLDEKSPKALKIVSYEKYEVSDNVDEETRTAVKQALQTAKDRFMSEMDTLVTSDHRNIYKVFTFGREEGHDWVVMPIYDESLQDVLVKDEAIEPKRLLSIAKQMAEGLQYAHDREITHRDMKPDNVMFLGDEVKLIDFGIAKPKNRATLTAIDSIIGTAKYIAPEQVMGNSDVAIDQYAYGLILFELLTRQFPFKLPMNDLLVINQRVMEEPQKLTEAAPQYSQDLERVISKMLTNDPVRRYNSVKSAYEAFEKAYLANVTATELAEPAG